MQVNLGNKSIHIDNVFLTSDNHFYHRNIIKYCNRPFTSWQEMNDTMIERWNSVVGTDQIVICAGDMTFRRGLKEEWANRNLLSKLNGRIYLLKGNHDPRNIYGWSRFEWVDDYYELHTDFERFPIVISHYPFLSWNHQYHGSMSFHGHVHSMEPMPDKTVRRVDIGVDAWASLVDVPYAPTPMKQVIDYVNENYQPSKKEEV